MTLCPSTKKCAVCEEVRDIIEDDGVKEAMKDGIVQVAKASCDNSTSFAKFVRCLGYY